MGRRGPAPLPTKLKILHGETRKVRLNRNEPKAAGQPRMPTDMSDEAKVVWRRLIRDFGATGVLTAVDVEPMRVYCEASVRYSQAARTLEASGPLVRCARSGELVKNPLHQIVRDNAVLLRAFGRELGFTPSARTGLVAGPQVDPNDPMERWLRSVGQ